jgi:hypothetical protein
VTIKDRPPAERRIEGPALQEGQRPFGGPDRAPDQQRSRYLAWAFSVVTHVLVFAALLWPRAEHPRAHAEPASMQVTFVNVPKPDPPGPPDDAAKLKAGDPQIAVQPTPPHLAMLAPVPSAVAPSIPDTSDLLSESQLAGATGVDDEGGGGGGGGGDCDTARLVQQALRRDPLVRTAVEHANRLGKAVMLWNGDWVRSGEQEGKGLSAVREAVIWELAFAPEACRTKRVHGTVLLSLADGSTRFAIGSGDWRWSDLLGLRGIASDR